MNPEEQSRLYAAFSQNQFTVRKKILKILGKAFHIYDANDNVVFFSELKAFKLKEDIRVYTGEDKRTEVLVIQARNVLDFSATYDVFDPISNTKVGALKRKGMKSIIQDEWIIMNDQDQEVGLIKEDSMALALIRRFLINLIPQNFTGELQGQPVCEFKQNFNPFVSKITLDYTMDQQGLLDRRVGIAAAILLCAIEGKQD